MAVARRRGYKKAIVALARRLAVVMHRIWVDETVSVGSGRRRLRAHDAFAERPMTLAPVEFRRLAAAVSRRTMDGVSSLLILCGPGLRQLPGQEACQIVSLRSTDAMLGGGAQG